jgi:hypothetical protein
MRNSRYCSGRMHSLIKHFITLLAVMLLPQVGLALPSYGDQLGVSCNQCHTVSYGPQLTTFGRQFKLNGYTLGGGKSFIPFSAMAIAAYDQTAAGQSGGAAPHYSDNNNVALQELSGFLAGRLSQHLGVFAQVTYSGVDRHTSWDNLDLRYTNQTVISGHDVVFGATLNNNPTIQDLWNSVPAWRFPVTSSDLAPTPAAATVIEDALAQTSLGLTAYAMIDNTFYVEAGGYRTPSARWLSDLGIQDAETVDRISGTAPYWRVMYQRQTGTHSFAVGLFGIAPHLMPGGDGSAGTDRYTDIGYDVDYTLSQGINTFDLAASYIHESRALYASTAFGDSDKVNNHLDTLRCTGTYTLQQKYAASIGVFDILGNANSGLYAAEEINGSANNSPNSRGYIVQFDYVPWGQTNSPAQPWMNLRLGVQYTGYSKFNGGSSNYDGFGRSARDNNTLYLFAWFAI